MIKCKKCGHTADKFVAICPECKENITLTRLELSDSLEEARGAMRKKEYEYAIEIYKALADMGVTEAEREYAAILERGTLVPRDLDGAMRYFFEAAKKNDGYSAYRYSRLAARTSDRASEFWIAYAALLGCREAFPSAAESYSNMGDEETAGYYYALAADAHDTDSIVTMAKRYYNGVGTERNEAYAKWYMDKLTLPPFHALKLAYKLRSVKAQLPPEPVFTAHTRIVRTLMRDAKKYKLHTAELHLAELLAKSGDPDALYTLGALYADRVGDGIAPEQAIETLEAALAGGNSEAAKLLGDIYVCGRIVPRSIERALFYYRRSAGGGNGSAYEVMGDIFREGRMVEPNVAYAIDLYDLGAREGDANCRRKSTELHEERERYYEMARATERSSPADAFENYALSTSMGYLPAHRELARCFEMGIGTKKDRRAAFTWYKIAVEAGDTDSYFDLGKCYAYGLGTPFNFDLAISALMQAKRFGNRYADEEITRLYENKKRGMIRSLFSTAIRLIYQKKFPEAANLLATCAEVGYPEGNYVLGCMYEFGLGLETSRTRAFEHYNRAFDAGFRDPRQLYKLKILKMAR